MTPDQMRANWASMKARAPGLGFEINTTDDTRIWNTFDAHRLLHWAGLEGRQLSPSDHDLLADAAEGVGLDRATAMQILATDRYADEVHEALRRWRGGGRDGRAGHLHNRYVINGGQPPEAFGRALRHIAKEEAGAVTAA